MRTGRVVVQDAPHANRGAAAGCAARRPAAAAPTNRLLCAAAAPPFQPRMAPPPPPSCLVCGVACLRTQGAAALASVRGPDSAAQTGGPPRLSTRGLPDRRPSPPVRVLKRRPRVDRPAGPPRPQAAAADRRRRGSPCEEAGLRLRHRCLGLGCCLTYTRKHTHMRAHAGTHALTHAHAYQAPATAAAAATLQRGWCGPAGGGPAQLLATTTLGGGGACPSPRAHRARRLPARGCLSLAAAVVTMGDRGILTPIAVPMGGRGMAASRGVGPCAGTAAAAGGRGPVASSGGWRPPADTRTGQTARVLGPAAGRCQQTLGDPRRAGWL
jgi:hypothetical protein